MVIKTNPDTTWQPQTNPCWVMAARDDSKWYFDKEKLLDTPSRKCGIEPEKELSYRQQAANLIQDMGQRLQVYPF